MCVVVVRGHHLNYNMFTDDSNVGTYHSLLALVLAYFNVVTYQTTEKYSPVKWIKFFPDG